ncbi:hypothetical protein [Streptomyces sp. BA2]|uniref:hypothetical protein n=1 Tax=Streptomyces sp. BA2 TaxID=436595 RepID=UPI0013206280|nr:hypothetical protein [Streptomyces sp. BA2]MWA08773.1 hypothetical protein [Streptomyces sp. BA2]
MTTRRTFHTSLLLTYQEGQRVFFVRDSERTPLTVQKVGYDATGRHPVVFFEAPDKPPSAYPHHLAHVDEALRPTLVQLELSHRELAGQVNAHTAGCSFCRREHVWWGTALRCLEGKRLIDAVGQVLYYRDNIEPWLTGKPVDPARLSNGQPVTVRPHDGPELDACVSRIATGIGWHEPGEGGLILVRPTNDQAPALYPIQQVFHRP